MYKYHFMPEKNVNFEISHTSLFKLIYKKLATVWDTMGEIQLWHGKEPANILMSIQFSKFIQTMMRLKEGMKVELQRDIS